MQVDKQMDGWIDRWMDGQMRERETDESVVVLVIQDT